MLLTMQVVLLPALLYLLIHTVTVLSSRNSSCNIGSLVTFALVIVIVSYSSRSSSTFSVVGDLCHSQANV